MSTRAWPRSDQIAALWHQWRHVVALLSFAAGVASFVLIQRQEKVAQALVILLPASWLLALLEPWLIRIAERRRLLRATPLLLSYLGQALHQESLFFTLPFFLATVTWASTQAVFVGGLILVALVSIIDPLYYGAIAGHRARLWSFHALAGFVTTLTAAPMLWQLTTTESLLLALTCAGALSTPAWWHALPRWGLLRGLLALNAGVALIGCGWMLRAAVPPATLWVSGITAARSVDADTREPLGRFERIDAATARTDGIVVWSSIHAPRGLHERIEHRWLHNGRTVDVIELDITGGREAGYRAWSRKAALPQPADGPWEVRVETQSGQLIGRVRFGIDAVADVR